MQLKTKSRYRFIVETNVIEKNVKGKFANLFNIKYLQKGKFEKVKYFLMERVLHVKWVTLY